ncbi:hypothetical protein ACOMHN_014109 [Nucella lapillus]
MEAVVEYDYEAEQIDELSLKVGDVIKNVVTPEGGWWEGELAGKKGMFPDNFVKLRSKAPLKEQKREATQRKSVRELANKFKDGVPLPGAQGSVMQRRKEASKMKKCKVLFDYKAENEDELDLTVGQTIDFNKEVEDGWWEGSVDGKVGVFPTNFVEMMEEGGEGAPTGDSNKAATGEGEGEFQAIKGKKVMGVGLGNIFQGGPIQLRSTAKKPKPEEKDEPKPPPTNPPDVSKREKQNTIERAVVRYSYAAEQPDELSLKEGEIIRLMDRQLEDEGWWRGELNGKVGVFPDNFVELLPAQEEPPSKAPKKPPPPVAKNIYPKLPEKVPSVEEKTSLVKKEPEAVPDKATPPVGSVKKPMFPPPVGRKPGIHGKAAELPSKPEPPKPAEPAVIVEMRHKEPASNHTAPPPLPQTPIMWTCCFAEGEEPIRDLDNVETSAHKLTHLTASRAKGPKKRPPSTVVFSTDMDKGGSDADDSTTKGTNHVHPQKPPPPVTKEAKHITPPDMERSHRQPSSHDSAGSHPSRDASNFQGSPAVSAAPPRPPEPSRHHDSSADSAALTLLVEELQREVREVRSQTVSRNEYNDLRSDHQKLKQDFEGFRSTQTKKLMDLMMEVDEEKKLRLNTQVEMERVKKLLAETHV